MVEPAALAQAVSRAHDALGLVTAFRDLTFRAVRLRHLLGADPPLPLFVPTTGGRGGSRYVRPLGPPAVYFAVAAETAHREVDQDFFRQLGGPGGPALRAAGLLRPEPIALFGAHVTAQSLLDLRAPEVHAHFATSPDELTADWLGVPAAPTQELGHAVEASGLYEGIIYPSARDPDGACLVLFPRRFRPGSVVDVGDPSGTLSGRLTRAPG